MRLLFLIAVAAIISIPSVGSAQCDSKKNTDSCEAVFPKGFIFSKSRVIEIKNKNELKDAIYAVTLSKGTAYVITVYEPAKNKNDGRMVINLLDNKDRLMMSSYNIETKKYYNKIVFNCNATGKYYLGYLFDGGESKGCGVSAFGFKAKK